MKEEANKTFSEQLDEMLPDMLIHSLSFDHREEVVEITYAELKDQADGVGIIKTVALERELFAVEIAEIESDLRDLVDEVVLAVRNEDALKARVARLKPEVPEEDDD